MQISGKLRQTLGMRSINTTKGLSFINRSKICLAAILLAGGCSLRQSYPETRISGYLHGQPFSIHAPKDSTLAGLDVIAETNGTIHVHVEHLECALNPTNLAGAANGQAAIVSATGAVISQAVSQAVRAAAKSTFAP